VDPFTEYSRRVVDIHGPRGRDWLERLPMSIAECERRWSIVVEAPFPNLSYNWVAPARTSQGASVVLKLGLPCPELTSEIETLRAWAGHGAAHLIHADEDEGALVIERVLPGTSLVELGWEHDVEATAVALELMQELHAVPPPPRQRTLADWTSGIERAVAAGFVPALTCEAERWREQLLASAPRPALLHADLHHYNILAAERQAYLAIDPKGIAGDPAYEPASFLYNPVDRWLGVPDADEVILRRVQLFATHFERRRVLGWALVQSLLSAWWSFEDHGHVSQDRLRFAQLFSRLCRGFEA